MGERPYWRVAVSIDGEKVLAIEPSMLAGTPDIDKYANEVRTCARHLLAFIGGADEDMTMPALTTITDEDVERAAKAFYNRQHEGIVGWHELEERYRAHYRDPIRAALEAFAKER